MPLESCVIPQFGVWIMFVNYAPRAINYAPTAINYAPSEQYRRHSWWSWYEDRNMLMIQASSLTPKHEPLFYSHLSSKFRAGRFMEQKLKLSCCIKCDQILDNQFPWTESHLSLRKDVQQTTLRASTFTWHNFCVIGFFNEANTLESSSILFYS